MVNLDEIKVKLTLYKDSEPCDCKECVGACDDNPGWPTPAEAASLIEQGYAEKLMLDWWEDVEDIFLLCPASKGCEGDLAKEMRHFDFFFKKGRCSLLDENNKCSIYGKPGRPIECRVMRHDVNNPSGLHMEVALAWDSEEGRAVLEQWSSITGTAITRRGKETYGFSRIEEDEESERDG
jgi:Fe-S-cluster containining protein